MLTKKPFEQNQNKSAHTFKGKLFFVAGDHELVMLVEGRVNDFF